jgi:hypothetical protein
MQKKIGVGLFFRSRRNSRNLHNRRVLSVIDAWLRQL